MFVQQSMNKQLIKNTQIQYVLHDFERKIANCVKEFCANNSQNDWHFNITLALLYAIKIMHFKIDFRYFLQ